MKFSDNIIRDKLEIAYVIRETSDMESRKESHPDYYECEICYEYFLKKDMAYIPEDDDNESLYICENCYDDDYDDDNLE